MTAPQAATPTGTRFEVLRVYADPSTPPRLKKHFPTYGEAQRYVAKRARRERWVIQLAFAIDEEPTP